MPSGLRPLNRVREEIVVVVESVCVYLTVRDILYDGQIGTGKLGVLEKIMSGYDFIRDSTILHGIF